MIRFWEASIFTRRFKRRAHPDHIRSNIKNDGGLLSVGSAAVDLGAFLSVTAAKKQGDRSGKL
jgi:hypothetical protein